MEDSQQKTNLQCSLLSVSCFLLIAFLPVYVLFYRIFCHMPLSEFVNFYLTNFFICQFYLAHCRLALRDERNNCVKGKDVYGNCILFSSTLREKFL